MLLFSSADFFKIFFFLSETLLGSRSGLTFCLSSSGSKLLGKGYQQTTIVAASKERVKDGHFSSNMLIIINLVDKKVIH